ncbi:MAG: M15 family metallopeptidase [Lactobacillales bacterium]|nr:M15 family metallopeptidase [Lactobacillales bacterium]
MLAFFCLLIIFLCIFLNYQKKVNVYNNEKSKILSKISLSDWNLKLVNQDHEISSDLVKLGIVQENLYVDERIVESTKDLLAAAVEAGYPLRIISAYRSIDDQRSLVEEGIERELSKGLSYEEAKAEVYRFTNRPGCSEHHTGLALDIKEEVDRENGKSTWLKENAVNFGFILRYPKGKEGITKIGYEPWHYRFVGVDVAKYLEKNQLVLEELVEQLEKGTA